MNQIPNPENLQVHQVALAFSESTKTDEVHAAIAVELDEDDGTEVYIPLLLPDILKLLGDICVVSKGSFSEEALKFGKQKFSWLASEYVSGIDQISTILKELNYSGKGGLDWSEGEQAYVAVTAGVSWHWMGEQLTIPSVLLPKIVAPYSHEIQQILRNETRDFEYDEFLAIAVVNLLKACLYADPEPFLQHDWQDSGEID